MNSNITAAFINSNLIYLHVQCMRSIYNMSVPPKYNKQGTYNLCSRYRSEADNCLSFVCSFKCTTGHTVSGKNLFAVIVKF